MWLPPRSLPNGSDSASAYHSPPGLDRASRPGPAIFRVLVLSVLTLVAGLQTSAAQVTSSELDGLRHRSIGPANMSGRLVDIAVVEMDTKVFYLASATGGVWKSWRRPPQSRRAARRPSTPPSWMRCWRRS